MTNITDPTTPAGSTHPTWDDPTQCAADQQGWHRSTPWILGSREAGMDLSVTVAVTQRPSIPEPAGDGETSYVDMTVHLPRMDDTDTDDEDYSFVLTPERAMALGNVLITAGQAAVTRR